MSRNIPSIITDELEKVALTPFYLVQMKINNTYWRFTDCEIDITTTVETSSATFQSRQFKFDDISYNNDDIVDAMQIRFDDVLPVLKAIFVENVISEEEFKIWLVLFDDSNEIIAKQNIFKGYMNEFDIDETTLTLTITSVFAKWAQTSYGKHSALCRWKKFKSTECKYAGAESACDRTYSRCTQLSNTDNFGGFRYIPGIEDLSVQWGPTQKEAEKWRSKKDPAKRKF
jgi:hypothetical protein